jgi:transglutaminase-like putative cysteine protease
MLGKDFRSLAEAVTGTYGDSPWFFLRELAQNSRDAGARNIRVEAGRTPAGLETLTFADDGRGMSFDHARRFLFRLYASDKAGDRMSAGKYGIGFWTVLGFQPATIALNSRTRKNSWAVVLNADLEVRPAECSLASPGTTVVLTRPAVFSTVAEFNRTVDSELRVYCQYLRRNDRRGTRLPVYFLGQNVTIPIRLPGPLSYSFHSGPVEGAVGIAEKPLVRLYARGLPVWEGVLLDQMSHLQTRSAQQRAVGQGQAPVFLLNGNRLDVTFARNLAMENKALEKVRETAEKALRRLLADSLESVFPTKWYRRGGVLLRTAARRILRPGWKPLLLALLVILPLEIMILRRFFPAQTDPGPNFFSLRSDSLNYPGAAVGFSDSQPAFLFTYSPPGPCWFRFFVAADYDLKAGFIRSAAPVLPPPPFQTCGPEKTTRMRLTVSRGGRTLLPLPPGHAIDPESLVCTPGQRPVLAVTSQDEYSVELQAGPGTVAYRSCPQDQGRELPLAEISRLTRLPEKLDLPAALAGPLAEAISLPAADRVARADALVRGSIRYDISGQTVRAYQRLVPGQPWLAGVLAIGKGDCDMINGVNVLFLRKMGIPARLVIGLIGRQGRIRSGLHAWSEYFDRGWKIVDASAGMAGATIAEPETEWPPLGAGNSLPPPPPIPGPGSAGSGDWLVPALAMAVVALVLAFLLKRKADHRRSAKITMPAAETGRELLLPIIQQALLQPEIWGRESPLWNHPFLPTAGGKPMAIRRALKLLRRGRLFFFSGRNPLAAAMNRSGIPVLDLSAECFTSLRNFFSPAVDLDLLLRLQPQPPAKTRKNADDLLAAVNAFLPENSATCLLSPGLRDADFLPVSLPATPRQRSLYFPRRFIAVNPSGNAFAGSSILYEKNRPLAIFRFLQALAADSLLPVADPQALLKKAARRLLRRSP